MVVNHNPICSCTAGYTGDPFVRCLKEERKNLFLLYTYKSIIFSYFFQVIFQKCFSNIFINATKNRILNMLYTFLPLYLSLLYSTCTSEGNRKPVRSITLRSKLSMSCYWNATSLLLSTKLYRSSAKLQA